MSGSLFPNKDILTKEIESWTSFEASLSSQEDRKLFMSMLNDCYKYSVAINAKGHPFPAEALIMALLLSQHKMIDWLTKQISKHELLANNNEVKKLKELKEQDFGRENTNDYIRKNERIHYIDDYWDSIINIQDISGISGNADIHIVTVSSLAMTSFVVPLTGPAMLAGLLFDF